jgi:hypothetical protein
MKLSSPRFAVITLMCVLGLCVSGRTRAQDVDLALRTQRAVQLDTPLNRTQWLGAHNAWNDSGALWANQRWSEEHLLDAGVRSFDLDLHRNSRGQIKLCHEDCSAFYAAEDDYENELAKFARWLDAHPGEILFIDLEDKVNDGPGVMDPLRRQFGSKLYVPSDKPQGVWETPRQMLSRGKRVIVKSANQTYGGVLIWDGRLFAVNASPGFNYREVRYFNTNKCTSDGFTLDQNQFYGVYDSKIIGSDTGSVSEANMGALLRCGVDFVDADRWNDSMRAAAVWTWAKGEPNNASDEDCTELNASGRWNDLACSATRPFACQDAKDPDRFVVTSAQGSFQEGETRCNAEYPGTHFSVPQNAYQNARLTSAAQGKSIWLNFTDRVTEGDFQRPK